MKRAPPPRSFFFVHHTHEQLAAAVQVGDAKAIRRKITYEKMLLMIRAARGEWQGLWASPLQTARGSARGAGKARRWAGDGARGVGSVSTVLGVLTLIL